MIHKISDKPVEYVGINQNKRGTLANKFWYNSLNRDSCIISCYYHY